MPQDCPDKNSLGRGKMRKVIVRIKTIGLSDGQSSSDKNCLLKVRRGADLGIFLIWDVFDRLARKHIRMTGSSPDKNLPRREACGKSG